MISTVACHPYAPRPNDPQFSPTIPDVSSIPAPANGSLYIEDTGLQLYQDIKAHRVGDILTIKLVEATQARKNANTDVKKEFEMESNATKLFGFVPKFNLRKFPIVKHFVHRENDRTLENDLNHDSEFKGSGKSDQTNSLSGDITVTIAQILPNKYLVVRGEKWITLNQGSEFIRVSGIVRPEDIGPDNIVPSNRIAVKRLPAGSRAIESQMHELLIVARGISIIVTNLGGGQNSLILHTGFIKEIYASYAFFVDYNHLLNDRCYRRAH